MVYSVPLGKLTAEHRDDVQREYGGPPSGATGWSDHRSFGNIGRKKMASETRSKTVVAPGFDILFEFLSNYGLPLLIVGVLSLLGFFLWNVTTFIPGAVWSIPK